MSQLITLTSDFGTQDGYIGAMKGRILSICPRAQLIDISHDLEPQALIQASWCLARSVPLFPPHTIHIAVIDPGVGSERFPLLIQTEQDQWLIGPDNGIFTDVLKRLPSVACYHIFRETAYWQAHRSFDGLALFAPVAAHLANGLALTEIGYSCKCLTQLTAAEPYWQDNRLIGEVQMFDRFGNAITTITAEMLQQNILKTIQCQGVSFPLVTHYAESGEHTALALINSDNRLELAHYRGSARQVFGLQEKATVIVS